jgi:hypothetical protein
MARSDCWLANFSRTGRYLVVVFNDSWVLCCLNQLTGEILGEGAINGCIGSGDSLEALDFSPGDEFLAYTTENRVLRVISLRTGESQELPGLVRWDSLSFSHRSATLLLFVSSSSDSLRLKYSVHAMFDCEVALSAKGSGPFKRAQFTCDDSRIVAAGSHMIAIFATATKELITTIPENTYYGRGWNILPHPYLPNLCAAMCLDGRASLWDIATREHLQALECITGNHATDALWTLDGQSLVVADDAGRISIFGAGGREISPLRVRTKPRISACYENHLHAFFHGKNVQWSSDRFREVPSSYPLRIHAPLPS